MRTKEQNRPYIGWTIFSEMLSTMDDGQLRTVDRLLRAEQRERQRREDHRQWTLWGAQAIRRGVTV